MSSIDEKLDRIISILERIEAKLCNEPLLEAAPQKENPAKKIGMPKELPSIAEIGEKFIKNHNKKISKAIDKGKRGLPLTKREQIIYKVHLEKKQGGS